MFTVRRLSGLAAIAIIFVLASPSVMAAPQALAVAKTSSPIDFVCEKGNCEVELTSMCLQYDRRFPGPRTAYHPTDAEAIALVLKKQSGEVEQVPAMEQATIYSSRSYTSVVVRLPEKWLNDNNIQQASLVVVNKMTLIPNAKKHEYRPQTAADIKKAAGPLRTLVDRWLSEDNPNFHRVEMLNRLLNHTPRSKNVSPSSKQHIWDAAVKQFPSSKDKTAPQKMFDLFNDCYAASASNGAPPLRRCLEMKHDTDIIKMNIDFWNASKPGV